VSREVHAGFCERRRVRLPPPTLLVVLVAGTRGHAEALREEVAAVLAPMGLRLSAAKTRICHIDEGFDFLGFRIQRHPKRGTAKRYVYTYPAKKALATVKVKLRALSRQDRDQPLAVLLHRLNQVLRGWTSYFKHGVSKRTFSYLRAFTWRRVARWLRRKHPRASWQWLRRRYFQGGGRRTERSCWLTPARSRSAVTATGQPASPHRGSNRYT